MKHPRQRLLLTFPALLSAVLLALGLSLNILAPSTRAALLLYDDFESYTADAGLNGTNGGTAAMGSSWGSWSTAGTGLVLGVIGVFAIGLSLYALSQYAIPASESASWSMTLWAMGIAVIPGLTLVATMWAWRRISNGSRLQRALVGISAVSATINLVFLLTIFVSLIGGLITSGYWVGLMRKNPLRLWLTRVIGLIMLLGVILIFPVWRVTKCRSTSTSWCSLPEVGAAIHRCPGIPHPWKAQFQAIRLLLS